jgi:benzodiazapine receptor
MTLSRMQWALCNAVGLVWALVWNTLANVLPLGGMGTGELSDLYPNLFVPAGVTFSIWGLIYLGLLGFVVAGFVFARRSESEDPLAAVGPWFVVNTLANGLWIVAWHHRLLPLSLVLMGVILASLIAMYLRLGVGTTPSRGGLESWAVRAPVSVYLGWITVATIANVTALAVDLGAPSFGPVPAALTVLVQGVAVGIAARMLAVHRDVAFAAVVVWAFVGIALARSGAPDAGASLVFATSIAGAAVVAMGLVATLVRPAPSPTR